MPTIAQLPSASAIANTDLFVVDQGATTRSATAALVTSYVITGLSLGTAAMVNVPIVPANGGTGVISPAAHTLPVAEGASDFTFIGPLTNGQLLVGSTGVDPVPTTITAGTNITVTNTAGAITISSSGGAGFSWNHITGTSQTMSSNNGYVADNSSLVTLTLPTTSNFGDELIIVGKGSGGWSINYTTSQLIHVGSSVTTTTSGSLSSSNAYDSVTLVCTVANTTWTAYSMIGNQTIA